MYETLFCPPSFQFAAVHSRMKNDSLFFLSLSLRMRNRIFFTGRAPSRAASVAPTFSSPPLSSFNYPARDLRATSVPPLPHNPLSPLDILSEYERRPFERCLSPTPVKCGRWAPRSSEVAFDSDGNLIFGILSSSCCLTYCFLLPVNHYKKC